MRNKINTMLVVCGLAVAVCTPGSVACDKDAATQCAAHQTVKQVVDGKSSCGSQTAQAVLASGKAACGTKAKEASAVLASGKSSCGSKAAEAAAVLASGKSACGSKAAEAQAVLASGKSSCGSKAAAATTVQASNTQGCPAGKVMHQLVMALNDMNECCSGGCKGRADVISAVRIIAESKPELACEQVTKMIATKKSCGTSQTVLAAAPAGQCCGTCQGAKAASNKACDPSQCSTKNAKVMAAGNKACDPANCNPAACGDKGKVIAASGKSSCGSAKTASYVAYNCEKTDRIARVAARAYLDLMRELKLTSGAEGCSAKAASEVLSAMVTQMQAQQTADASKTVEVEVVPVSLGAVSDKAAKSSCGSSRN